MKQDIKVVQGQGNQDGTGIVVTIRAHSVSLIPRGMPTNRRALPQKLTSLPPDNNTKQPLLSRVFTAMVHGVVAGRSKPW